MASQDLATWLPSEGGTVSRSRAVPRSVERGLAGGVGFFVLWWAVAATMPSYLLPTPIAVLSAFLTELTTPATLTIGTIELPLTELTVVLAQSLMHYLPGLFIGVGLGAPLGLVLGYSTVLDEYVSPVVSLLRPIPPLAWMGLVIVWVGIGHAGAAVIVSIGAFWITFFAAYGGVEELPQEWVEVAESLGVEDDLTMLRKVVIPGSAPSIFTGIRTSIGRAWMIVVAAELFGAPGIGYRIIHTAQSLSMDLSMAYMLALGLVYLGSDVAFRGLREVIEP